MSYAFKQVMVTSDKHKLKCPYKMDAQYITVHNTANDASAANEVAYHNRNNNQVSYHVAVDDKEVIQCIPFNRIAWHCGDGRGNGNMKSIGIEICYSKSGGERYKQAEENAVQYIAKLLHERGWGIDRVKKHQDWSKKFCPHRILAEKRWNSFKQRVQVALNKLKQPATTTPEVADKEETDMFKLDNTSKSDFAKLFKKAYEDGIFSTDHSSKVHNYDDEKIYNLYVSYQIRKELAK